MKKTMLILALMAMLMLIATAGYAYKGSPIESFDITPNPMFKECVISLAVSVPLNINVQIQSCDGKVICDLYEGFVGKDIYLNWERTDNYGNYVPDGEYFVVVNFSTRYTSLKKTLILK
jgi:hypothetical protein